jgi:hypothetical protein
MHDCILEPAATVQVNTETDITRRSVLLGSTAAEWHRYRLPARSPSPLTRANIAQPQLEIRR